MLDHREVVADEQVGQAQAPGAAPPAGSGSAPARRRRARWSARRRPRCAGAAPARGRSPRAGAGRRRAGRDSAPPARRTGRRAPASPRRDGPCRRPATSPCAASGIADDVAHPPARVERGEGVLEHRLDQPGPRAPVEVGQALAVDQHLAGRGRQQAQDEARQGGLAAAALSHHAQHAAGGQREGHVVHRHDLPGLGEQPLRARGKRGARSRTSMAGVAVMPPLPRPSRPAGGRGIRAPAAAVRRGTARGAARRGMGAAVAEGAAREARRDPRHDAGDAAQGLVRAASCRAPGRSSAGRACRGGAGAANSSAVGALSTTSPGIHDGDPVRDARDDAEVMGDQQDAEAEIALQHLPAAAGSAPAR